MATAREMGKKILDVLMDRKGFDNWFRGIDVEIQTEIQYALGAACLGGAKSPLVLAREAMDAAASEFADAYEKWDDGIGYADMEIKPDYQSMGMMLELDFNDGPMQSAESIVEKFGPLLRKHGIETVRTLSVDADEAEVPVDE